MIDYYATNHQQQPFGSRDIVRQRNSIVTMPGRTSPKLGRSTNKFGPRTQSGQSSTSSTPNFGRNSANSTLKSANGSINSDLDDFDGDNINVVVRVRPLNNKETKAGDESIIQFPGDGGIWVDERKGDEKLKPFTFNVVFEPEAGQEDVLEHSGVKRLIDMAVDGFSTTCFCYGQTGSGKTHTLTGPPYLFQKASKDQVNRDHGLVYRSFIYLFEELKARSNDATFVIKASYLEIYNEKVIDLLNPGPKRSNLTVRWNKKSRAFVVDNLFSIECAELEDLVAVLEEGLKNRAIGMHNMNEHSSRSHTILTVHIHSEEKATTDENKGVFITRHGKINFVDLAGSEMTKKTKSEGKTLEEANNINKSLMVLGYCIAQLSTQRRTDKGVHIPYRDSKLTKLLADSLAGNGVTLMIACVSPAQSNLCETINTLRYAARAKKIKTKPVVVMDPREALIVSLKREVGILNQENNHLRNLLQLSESNENLALRQGTANSLPLDGRESSLWNGSLVEPDDGADGGHLSDFERPQSERSRATLRQVSSLLFIATPATVKKIDKSRLSELDSSTLVELIKDYMNENQELRKENQDLFAVRDMMLRDQEIVCRENERLLKKLEDVNSVCCRSPIMTVRPSYSAELLSMSFNGSLPRTSSGERIRGSAPDLSSAQVTNIWTNPIANNHKTDDEGYPISGLKSLASSRSSVNVASATHSIHNGSHRLPPDINKELEKRKIGSSLAHLDKSLRKHTQRGSAADSEGSLDEMMNQRKKPVQIHDNLTANNRLKSGSGPLQESREAKKGAIRKERAKRLRGHSTSRESVS